MKHPDVRKHFGEEQLADLSDTSKDLHLTCTEEFGSSILYLSSLQIS